MLLEQGRIADDGLHAIHVLQLLGQRDDMLLILVLVQDDDGVRLRENFLYLRLTVGAEEYLRLAGKVIRKRKQTDGKECHRYLMAGSKPSEPVCR